MDKKTAGYEGWKEVRFFEGKDREGNMIAQEGFRNIQNGEDFKPEEGWNGAPPYRTGELNMHVSSLYRKHYDEIRWDK